MPKKPPAAAPEDASVKTERYSCSLKVLLTAAEIADRADRAAQKLAERDAKEEEQKAATKHAKSVIEALDAELRRLSNEVRTRSTYAMVECLRTYDHEAGQVREVRLDTHETLSERNMTDAERQQPLPFDSQGQGAEE